MPPFDAATAIHDENGTGDAWLNVACYVGGSVQPPTSYEGPLWEFIMRCDAAGTSDITLDGIEYTQLVGPPPNFEGASDHVHNATVTCTQGGSDADSDGMPDVYEDQHPCLNANVPDASADPDHDDSMNSVEYQVGTLPCDVDTDNDGCADGEEAATNPPLTGGQRNPLNGFDFYDVNGTKKVDSVDINLVRRTTPERSPHQSRIRSMTDRRGPRRGRRGRPTTRSTPST